MESNDWAEARNGRGRSLFGIDFLVRAPLPITL